MERNRGPRDWESWIDRKIREAQEQGAFDDLPGRGKPLDLQGNPYAQDRELSFKILKDAGYAPEWIELDKAIRMRLERTRMALSRSWEWHQARLLELAGSDSRWASAERERSLNTWQTKLAHFEAEIAALNGEIRVLNLMVPSPRFQRSRVNAAREIRLLTEAAE